MGDTAKLSSIVEGVEFTIHDGLVTVRELILRDALEVYFGAGASADTWLQVYQSNRAVIHAAAVKRYRAGPRPLFTILRVGGGDFDADLSDLPSLAPRNKVP
ncbi:MAG TPA: DUF1488 family protein [Albitalea sp.]|uniref:DUF1488 family protein n=1 Tax=Piscinibacter sp. TaxID=1903157 RepID=UPI002ED53972